MQATYAVSSEDTSSEHKRDIAIGNPLSKIETRRISQMVTEYNHRYPKSDEHLVHFFWTSGGRETQTQIGGQSYGDRFPYLLTLFLESSDPNISVELVTTGTCAKKNKKWLRYLKKCFPDRFDYIKLSQILRETEDFMASFQSKRSHECHVLKALKWHAKKGNPAIASDLYRLLCMIRHEAMIDVRHVYTDIDTFCDGLLRWTKTYLYLCTLFHGLDRLWGTLSFVTTGADEDRISNDIVRLECDNIESYRYFIQLVLADLNRSFNKEFRGSSEPRYLLIYKKFLIASQRLYEDQSEASERAFLKTLNKMSYRDWHVVRLTGPGFALKLHDLFDEEHKIVIKEHANSSNSLGIEFIKPDPTLESDFLLETDSDTAPSSDSDTEESVSSISESSSSEDETDLKGCVWSTKLIYKSPSTTEWACYKGIMKYGRDLEFPHPYDEKSELSVWMFKSFDSVEDREETIQRINLHDLFEDKFNLFLNVLAGTLLSKYRYGFDSHVTTLALRKLKETWPLVSGTRSTTVNEYFKAIIIDQGNDAADLHAKHFFYQLAKKLNITGACPALHDQILSSLKRLGLKLDITAEAFLDKKNLFT